MNILYLVSTLEKTGPTRQLFYIVSNLDRSLFDPVVVTLSPEPEKSMKENFERIGIKVQSLNMSRLKGLFCAKRKVKEIIKNENVSIVHSNFIRADMIAVNLGIKSVLNIRYDPMFVYPEMAGRFIGYVIARYHMRIHCKADVPVACSQSIAFRLQEYTGINFQYIRNGIDLKANPYVDMAERKSLINNKNIFLTAGSAGRGNNEKGKNIATVISAFESIEKDDVFLQIAGYHGLGTDFRSSMKIKELGFVENMTSLFSKSLFFISASFSEGMPNAVLEAMSNGMPVILSDIPPHREIVEGTVLEKYLFRADDEHDLKEMVLQIVKDDYKLLSEASRNIVETRFDAKKVSEKYMKLYESLMRNA